MYEEGQGAPRGRKPRSLGLRGKLFQLLSHLTGLVSVFKEFNEVSLFFHVI